MCDEDTAALVVDNGSGMCKVSPFGSDWIRLDQIGSDWIRLDQIGSDWIRLDQMWYKINKTDTVHC